MKYQWYLGEGKKTWWKARFAESSCFGPEPKYCLYFVIPVTKNLARHFGRAIFLSNFCAYLQLKPWHLNAFESRINTFDVKYGYIQCRGTDRIQLLFTWLDYLVIARGTVVAVQYFSNQCNLAGFIMSISAHTIKWP